MGAWGAGAFDNDDALDFVSEIASLADLEAQLTAAGTEGEIEADHAARILVAGECVAAMRGHRHKSMPDDLAKTVLGFGKPSMDLLETMHNNVSAVIARSELTELWAEEGSGEWQREMTGLIERLTKPAKKPRKPRKKKPQANLSPCMFCDKPMGDDAFHMIDVTLNDDEISSMRMGGWVHLACLNAALHPKHMIQNWQLDDEMLEHIMAKIKRD